MSAAMMTTIGARSVVAMGSAPFRSARTMAFSCGQNMAMPSSAVRQKVGRQPKFAAMHSEPRPTLVNESAEASPTCHRLTARMAVQRPRMPRRPVSALSLAFLHSAPSHSQIPNALNARDAANGTE